MYNSILIPVDFSPESVKAVEHAVKFLSKDGKITVFHVFPSELPSYLSFFQDMSFFGDASKIEASIIEIREKAEEKLAEIVGNYSEKGTNIDAELADGKPYVEIIKKSREYELVVMGLTEKNYGVSVSPMKVIRKSESDVFVMKGDVDFSLKRVLFPIDIHEINPKIMKRIGLLKENGAEIYILGVVEMMPFEDVEYLGGRDLLNLEAVKEKTLAVLTEKVGVEDANYTVSIGVDVASEIDSFALKKGIDVVIMGHKKMSGFERTILGSTTEKFVNISKVPVLIVK